MAQILAPYDIQSIHSKHPQLPQHLVYAFGLDSSLVHNAPITPKLVKDAENTAVGLERLQELHPPITEAVIWTAKSRATSISQAYSSAEFNGPAPPAAAMMDAIRDIQASLQRVEESLERVENCQKGLEAWKDNTRIGKANLRAANVQKGTTTFRAKVKEVAGDGTELANTLAPNIGTHLVALPQPPVVGTAYHIDIIAPHNLTHNAIQQMIRFYNESFDIEFGDTIVVRSQKVREWLTDF